MSTTRMKHYIFLSKPRRLVAVVPTPDDIWYFLPQAAILYDAAQDSCTQVAVLSRESFTAWSRVCDWQLRHGTTVVLDGETYEIRIVNDPVESALRVWRYRCGRHKTS